MSEAEKSNTRRQAGASRKNARGAAAGSKKGRRMRTVEPAQARSIAVSNMGRQKRLRHFGKPTALQNALMKCILGGTSKHQKGVPWAELYYQKHKPKDWPNRTALHDFSPEVKARYFARCFSEALSQAVQPKIDLPVLSLQKQIKKRVSRLSADRQEHAIDWQNWFLSTHWDLVTKLWEDCVRRRTVPGLYPEDYDALLRRGIDLSDRDLSNYRVPSFYELYIFPGARLLCRSLYWTLHRLVVGRDIPRLFWKKPPKAHYSPGIADTAGYLVFKGVEHNWRDGNADVALFSMMLGESHRHSRKHRRHYFPEDAMAHWVNRVIFNLNQYPVPTENSTSAFGVLVSDTPPHAARNEWESVVREIAQKLKRSQNIEARYRQNTRHWAEDRSQDGQRSLAQFTTLVKAVSEETWSEDTRKLFLRHYYSQTDVLVNTHASKVVTLVSIDRWATVGSNNQKILASSGSASATKKVKGRLDPAEFSKEANKRHRFRTLISVFMKTRGRMPIKGKRVKGRPRHRVMVAAVQELFKQEFDDKPHVWWAPVVAGMLSKFSESQFRKCLACFVMKDDLSHTEHYDFIKPVT